MLGVGGEPEVSDWPRDFPVRPRFGHSAHLGLNAAPIPWWFRCKAIRQEINESANFRRGVGVWQENRMDGGVNRRMIQVERDERAQAQLVRDDEGRLVDDALTSYRRRAQRAAIVSMQVARNGHDPLASAAERPFVAGQAARQRVAETIVLA